METRLTSGILKLLGTGQRREWWRFVLAYWAISSWRRRRIGCFLYTGFYSVPFVCVKVQKVKAKDITKRIRTERSRKKDKDS